MSLVEDAAALRSAVGGVVTDREVVEVAGPDAATFLQGQLSQDVLGLGEGDSAWTFVLHPDGKVAVWGRVTRLGPERFVLDVDGGAGDAVVTRLSRFKLRVDATIERLDWTVVALRGPESPAVDTGGAVTADPAWPGVVGVDLLGPEVAVPGGVRPCDPAALEALRIEAGVPAMGAELDDHTIPAEAGVVERSVSFTKGCYPGQELTARIDSRGGNVPRHLMGVVVDGPPPEPDAVVTIERQPVGAITSSAIDGSAGATVALAFVKRSVEVVDGGTPAEVAGVPATLVRLPIG